MATILVVNSDPSARRTLVRRLHALGHTVVDSADAKTALDTLHQVRARFVLCDTDLEDGRGLELLRAVRLDESLHAIRVIMIADAKDASQVFAAGADDFIRKPVDPDELAARIDACPRRAPALLHAESISSGGLTIDNVSKRLKVDGRFIPLAPREYRLLHFFLKNQERVFTREQLLASVWDHDASVGARTVDVHIRRLRSLLESSGYDRYLQTVRGSGYRYSLTP